MSNHLRRFLTILALFSAPLAAFGDYGKTWVGAVTGTANWHADSNWNPTGEPDGDDTVLIDPDQQFGGQNLTIEITDDDAACKSLDIVSTESLALIKLVIQGRKLTLGDPNADMTSVIWGEIVFEEAGNNPAQLEVHNWVTFTVPVDRFCFFTATESANSTDSAEFIRDSTDGEGVEFAEGSGELNVIGQFIFLISVKHDATFFGVKGINGVMEFGLLGGSAFSPVLEISGTSLNAETIKADPKGRVEFHDVKFASTAPAWLMKGQHAEFRVTDTINNVPNDITIESSALLNLRDNFTCNGKLTHKAGTIRVKACKSATIVAP
ncbi:MAG: hypothetical protein IH986_02090 [Planctomycetes bacterium]|nr:hypothetical protein [Planctomycetota bacterium]